MEILIEVGDWGNASRENIRVLLEDVAGQFTRHLAHPSNYRLRIECHPDQPAPMALRRASPNDVFVIWLTARDTHWAQFSYQFAHEFCHILADFERLWSSPNQQWFQESLCELASIFALKQMAISWQIAPPYPNWFEFSPHLDAYADELLTRSDHRLPPGLSLNRWLQQHEPELRANSCNRILNGVVAVQLYPLFRGQSNGWQAVASMPECNRNFADFLSKWHSSCPNDHQDFVSKVAEMFEIKV